MIVNAQNPLDTFSRNFTIDEEVAACCRLVSNTADYLAMSRCR